VSSGALLLVLLLAAAHPAPPAQPSGGELEAIAKLVESGRLGPAEQQLRRLLARDATSAAAHDLLGVVLARQERFDEARKEFEAALSLAPDQLAVRQHLARVELALKRDAEALEELRRAARLGPLDRDLALRLAGAESTQGDPDAAARLLRSAAERGSVSALLQLARLQSRQKDVAGAADSLKKARELAPNSEEVLRAWAELALATHSPAMALSALEPLTRVWPEVAQYHYLMGVALMQAGDMPAASESLTRAQKLEPDRPLTLIALGLAQNARKLYDQARSVLQKALELEPESLEALAALAEAEQGQGDLADAEGHALRALERAPQQATANLVLGMVRLEERRYAEARDALLKAEAAEPGSAKTHYQLSLAYARLGDQASSEQQVALYQKALKDAEARLIEIRSQTGLPGSGGMHP
jgi:tetratricopeptide (TPR) repeat protein